MQRLIRPQCCSQTPTQNRPVEQASRLLHAHSLGLRSARGHFPVSWLVLTLLYFDVSIDTLLQAAQQGAYVARAAKVCFESAFSPPHLIRGTSHRLTTSSTFSR